jgi:hypothetical protein
MITEQRKVIKKVSSFRGHCYDAQSVVVIKATRHEGGEEREQAKHRGGDDTKQKADKSFALLSSRRKNGICNKYPANDTVSFVFWAMKMTLKTVDRLPRSSCQSRLRQFFSPSCPSKSVVVFKKAIT